MTSVVLPLLLGLLATPESVEATRCETVEAVNVDLGSVRTAHRCLEIVAERVTGRAALELPPGGTLTIRAGRIVIDGYIEAPGGSLLFEVLGGQAIVRGRLDASDAEGKGGQISIQARDLSLRGAKLIAYGRDQGGRVLLGADDFSGVGAVAESIVMDRGTEVDVSGGRGEAVVFAMTSLDYRGRIDASVGMGGQGGRVELSGREKLALGPGWASRVDVDADGGRAGTLVLDPTDIVIVP